MVLVQECRSGSTRAQNDAHKGSGMGIAFLSKVRSGLVGMLAAAALAACSAETVEIKISSGDIKSALAGEEVTVPFEATFSMFGDLDDDQRAQIGDMEKLVRDYLTIDGFEIERDSTSTKIVIEGELPLVTGHGSGDEVWAIAIGNMTQEPVAKAYSHALQFWTGGRFEEFADRAQRVSFMLAPSAAQPIRFRIRADKGDTLHLLAGGVQLQGESKAISILDVAGGESVSLVFKGGAYEDTGAGFLFALE
jgi:hypothetical protein